MLAKFVCVWVWVFGCVCLGVCVGGCVCGCGCLWVWVFVGGCMCACACAWVWGVGGRVGVSVLADSLNTDYRNLCPEQSRV